MLLQNSVAGHIEFPQHMRYVVIYMPLNIYYCTKQNHHAASAAHVSTDVHMFHLSLLQQRRVPDERICKWRPHPTGAVLRFKNVHLAG